VGRRRRRRQGRKGGQGGERRCMQHVGFGGSRRGSGRGSGRRGRLGSLFGGVFGGGLGGVVGARGATWWWSSCRRRLRHDGIQEAPPRKGKKPPLGFLLLEVHESRSCELAAPIQRYRGTPFGSEINPPAQYRTRHLAPHNQTPPDFRAILTCCLASQPPCRGRVLCAGSAPQKINQPPQHRAPGLR
jgi:hypothetical protein